MRVTNLAYLLNRIWMSAAVSFNSSIVKFETPVHWTTASRSISLTRSTSKLGNVSFTSLKQQIEIIRHFLEIFTQLRYETQRYLQVRCNFDHLYPLRAYLRDLFSCSESIRALCLDLQNKTVLLAGQLFQSVILTTFSAVTWFARTFAPLFGISNTNMQHNNTKLAETTNRTDILVETLGTIKILLSFHFTRGM